MVGSITLQKLILICFQIKAQKCDFHMDCSDDTDEKECPPIYLFDDCLAETENENCGFVEDPIDELDWIIGSSRNSGLPSH